MNFEFFIAQRMRSSSTSESTVSGRIIKIAITAIALGMVMMLIALGTSLGLQKEKISPENAWQLIRIDEEWQRDKWGRLDEHKKEDRINKAAFMHSCRVLKLVKSQ